MIRGRQEIYWTIWCTGIPTIDSPNAFLTLLVLTLSNASMAFSQELGKFKDLDPGPGIAVKYVGDAGIEGDASVIFAEDFETGSLAQIAKRWGHASINHLWLEHYVDEGAQRHNKVTSPNRVNRVWFDDIVVATEYLGPVKRVDLKTK